MTVCSTRPPDGAPAPPGAWATAWMLLLFMVVNFADKAVLGLAGPEIMRELGLNRQEFGATQAAFFALFSLSAIGVSLLTRTVRTTVLLLLMALAWSAAQLPMLAASAGFGTLIATRVLLGAAEGPAAPVAVHHLYGWFPQRERTLPTAVLLVGAAVGVAVAAPALSLVIGWWGWRWAFGAVGCAGLLWAAVWAVRGGEGQLAPPLTGRGRRRDAAGPSDASGPPAAARVAGVGEPSLRRILLSPTVLAGGFGCFAAYWLMSSQLTWVPDYLHTALGWDTHQVGIAVAAGALGNAAVLLGHGMLSRRPSAAGRRRLPSGAGAGLLMVCSAVAVAVFVTAQVLWLKLPMMLGMGLSMVMMTVGQTACGRITTPRLRGVVLGTVVGVASLGGVLAPLVLGRVVDAAPTAVTGYTHAWLLTAALLALAGLLAALFLRPERDALRLGVPEP
ncbi:MFS transporter [Streptomyces sp. NPDC057939]|uniref:MFS transporter n=1 Tax=Streptomyces sp. NPDC057939 TaxID=3346284 RepID=UPI0036ED55A9